MSDGEGVTMSKIRPIALAVAQKLVFRRRIRDSVARRRPPVARLVLAFAVVLGMVMLPLAVATAAGDTTAPALTSFSFSPTTVDTSASAQTISVTAHLSDDIAGVRYAEFSFVGPSNQSLYVSFDASDRTSGTALDGTYQANLSVPRYTAEGPWTADYFYMRDEVGNTRSLRTADLSAAGFSTSFTQTGSTSGDGGGGGGGGAPPSSSDPNSTNNTAPVPSSMGVSQHERSVTLKLTGALRVSGDVNVSDGFAECASSVPVKLQRKVSGSWKTVKSVTTSATGSYRAELADRSGTYRALVSTTAMPSGDTCAKTISQQRLAT